MSSAAARIGVVAIGRNEGDRLRQCLASLAAAQVPVVYVDSGSTDGSVALADGFGATVVALDMAIPFTAARARNAGFRRLMQAAPQLPFVMFVDGDCEVHADWIGTALAFLDAHPDVVAVGGQRRERHPERSIYNRLTDLDWHWRPGPTRSIGGDAVMRTTALRAAGGYAEHLIAGEEPELCIRLRAGGGRIWQLDVPMTLHDANMLHFGQWWKRTVRTGWAYAEGAAMHGAPPERHWVAERRRAAMWGLALPLAVLLVLPWSRVAAAGLLLAYPLQWARLALASGQRPRLAAARAGFTLLGKFAEAAGVVRFTLSRWRRQPARLIEYK